jgi:hypothetical protein
MHRDPLEARAEFRQHRCEGVDEWLGGHAERDLARIVAAQLLHFLFGPLAFAENRAGPLQQALAERGQRDSAVRAGEQGRAQHRFEVLQLLRDAALGDAERPRRRANAAMLGHSGERA